jgi:endonuclease YncB( thermonuclease family)
MKSLVLAACCLLFTSSACNDNAATQPDPKNAESTISLGSVILGKVVGVTDGDTITVLDGEKQQHKIRLEGIDTPESHQAFGTQSTKALSEKIFGKQVKVKWEDQDRYRRILGHIYLDDRWINKEMVEEGWAWHYKKYSTDKALSAAESNSRLKKLGLWKDAKPIAPWDFRSNPLLAEQALQPFKQVHAETNQNHQHEITVYATRTGKKYHRDGCRFLSKSKIPISLIEAVSRYGPCSVCNPPTKLASTPKAERAPPPQQKPFTFYVTRSGAKYHRGGCRYLRKSSIPIQLNSAKARYSPCSVCNPPC